MPVFPISQFPVGLSVGEHVELASITVIVTITINYRNTKEELVSIILDELILSNPFSTRILPNSILSVRQMHFRRK